MFQKIYFVWRRRGCYGLVWLYAKMHDFNKKNNEISPRICYINVCSESCPLILSTSTFCVDIVVGLIWASYSDESHKKSIHGTNPFTLTLMNIFRQQLKSQLSEIIMSVYRTLNLLTKLHMSNKMFGSVSSHIGRTCFIPGFHLSTKADAELLVCWLIFVYYFNYIKLLAQWWSIWQFTADILLNTS